MNIDYNQIRDEYQLRYQFQMAFLNNIRNNFRAWRDEQIISFIDQHSYLLKKNEYGFDFLKFTIDNSED